MLLADPIYTANMSDQQRAWFYAEYERARKDEVVGVLLAIFLGCFGIHHFYLRRNGLGIVYLLLCWTGISAILGLIDAFFMPGRVRAYNGGQASFIASQILASTPHSTTQQQSAPHCTICGGLVEIGAAYCPHCGAAIASANQLRAQPSL